MDTFNASAIGYIEEVIDYQEILEEVEETNTLGEQLVNLVRHFFVCFYVNQYYSLPSLHTTSNSTLSNSYIVTTPFSAFPCSCIGFDRFNREHH